MADIQDMLQAERNADDIGRLLVQHAETVGENADQYHLADAVVELGTILSLGFQLVAAEIRAAGVRQDYVLRDEMRRAPRG